MPLTAADRNQLQRYSRNLLVPAMVAGTVIVLGFVWLATRALLEPATHLLVFGLSCAGWFALLYLYYRLYIPVQADPQFLRKLTPDSGKLTPSIF